MRAWLFGILHNQYLKAAHTSRRVSQLDESLACELAAPVDRAETDDERLQQSLGRPDDDHRLPLLLHLMEELPVAEIARMLEIPGGTVTSRIHRARKNCKP
jgi:RNA polymerase sigma-70 factor, ECF subfamily